MPVCIAGMHRSGTSLIAHLLHDCGLYLGPEQYLFAATESNLDGHWEHAGFVALNDQILNALGGGWDCPPKALAPWTAPALKEVREKADRLSSEFAGREPWGWKDPRNSLTIPLWKDIFPDLRLVVCVRNPLEVAMSLRVRGMSSYPFALNLWKTYYQAIFDATGAESRCVVSYSDCLSNANAVLQRTARFCGMPVDEAHLAPVKSAIKPTLRHHTFTDEDLVKFEVADDIAALYRRLVDEAVGAQPNSSSKHSGRNSMPTYSTTGKTNAARKSNERKKTGSASTATNNLPSIAAHGQPAIDATAIDTDTLWRSMTDLRAALDQSDGKLSESQGRLETLGKERDALAKTLSQHETTIAEFETTRQQLQAECERLALQIAKTDALHSELHEMKLVLNESHAASQAAQVAAVAEVSQQLHQELCEVKQSLGESLAASHTAQAAAGAEIGQQLASSAANFQQTHLELQGVKEAIADQQRSIEARDAIAIDLQKKIGQLTSLVMATQKERAELQSVLAGQAIELVESRKQLERGHSSLIEQGRAMTDRFDSMRAELNAASQAALRTIDRAARRTAARDKKLARSSRLLSESLLQREDDYHGLVYDLCATQAASSLHGAAASGHMQYEQLLHDIREVVRTCLPRKAVPAVVSKGDNAMLRQFGRKAQHFPQNDAGVFSGFYPADSIAAIAHLEWLRSRGVTHFLLPAPAMWWFDSYPAFRVHIETRYRLVADQPDVCRIYALGESPQLGMERSLQRFAEMLLEFRYHFHRDPVVVDWSSGLELAGRYPALKVLSPQLPDLELPYMDHTIDIVVVPAEIDAMVAEARRVAESCLLVVGDAKLLAHDNLEVSWRAAAFPAPRDRTSIIVPVHNQLAVTETCLATLVETIPASFDVEIIVVDDASTDATGARLMELAASDPRIRVVRNVSNAGFLASANRAAAEAAGEFLIFVNNDTVLLPGWFPALLQTFRDFPDAGAVGGRLLFPDGRLQEAGGMVFCDGSAGHFGRDDYNLAAEAYNQVREVDYCSGALLATPRKLFEQLGGFDPAYGFGYYEDTDYCFRVRRKGQRVYYQPASTIVHLEGASAGTDLSVGAKRYQVVNQALFAERWREELARQPRRPDYSDKAAWNTAAFHRSKKDAT